MTFNQPIRAAFLVGSLILAAEIQAAERVVRFVSQPGSHVVINGGNSVHEWQVKGEVIEGEVVAGVGFPVAADQRVKLGDVEGQMAGSVPVRSLQYGLPRMDKIMYAALKEEANPHIHFRFKDLTLRRLPSTNDPAFVLDAAIELVIAGMTNRSRVPVSVLLQENQQFRISGSLKVRMSDFGIKPPEAQGEGFTIRTRDEVHVSFDWHVAPERKSAASGTTTTVPSSIASTTVRAQQYVQIEADFELTTYRSGDTDAAAEAKPIAFSVQCITSTSEWRIDHNFFKMTGDSDRWDWNRWFYDGANVYSRLKVVSPFSGTNATVNIWPSEDGCPLGDPAVNITWLAFCSGSYLNRPGRLVPLPLDVLRHTPDRFGYSDSTERFNDSFGLPKSVDLISSQELVRESALQFHKGWFLEGRYGEFDRTMQVPEGVLTFHYSVTASTNFLGTTFPLRFEFYQKGRPYQQNGDWDRHGIGVVRSIRTVEKPEGLFDPAGQTVVDWRFRDLTNGVNAITYTWTNASAPAITDPRLEERFNATRERNGRRLRP
jgi:hypothetical protein